MTQPYTYLLRWSDANLSYYGVRYARDCHPDDLWNTYFTSSKYVDATVSTYGPPDIIKIDKLFETTKAALEHERNYLIKHDVLNNDMWLNRNISGIFERAPMTGKRHSDVAKAKMSASSKGKLHSDETRLKMSESKSGSKHPFYQKTHSKQARQKISESEKGVNNHQFKGYFVTPWGKFATTKEASMTAPIKISSESIRKWCTNSNKIIPLTSRKAILFKYKGYSYKEAGFYFDAKSEELP